MALQFVRKTTDMGWPEEGAEWWYTVLPEPVLSSELARLSFANSYGDTDAVTFQPCPNPEQSSQDRFVIKDWPLANGTWSFRAVFDGQLRSWLPVPLGTYLILLVQATPGMRRRTTLRQRCLVG
jgi:hypothetical protein